MLISDSSQSSYVTFKNEVLITIKKLKLRKINKENRSISIKQPKNNGSGNNVIIITLFSFFFAIGGALLALIGFRFIDHKSDSSD